MKEIKDFKNYFITDTGEVYSRARGSLKKLKTKISNCGYVRVTLSLDDKQYYKSVHRLVAQSFVEGYSEDLQVNHLDGNKLNNLWNNLRMCSATENQKHAYATGLKQSPRGSQHHNSKLTEQDIRDIRNYLHKYTQRAIADKYNVSPTTIRDIQHRKTWAHIAQKPLFALDFSYVV